MTTTIRKPDRGFTGVHMWILAISFFGVIIAVNVGMATLAYRSWTGLVVDNSYVESQAFEGKRMAHERQKAAGWQATLTYLPGAAHLVIVDGARSPVDLGSVSIQINRPVGGHDDRRLELARNADGSYEAAVDLPHGLWDATVAAPNTALGPFELHERVRVETGQ